MKKIVVVTLIIILICGLAVGCGKTTAASTTQVAIPTAAPLPDPLSFANTYFQAMVDNDFQVMFDMTDLSSIQNPSLDSFKEYQGYLSEGVEWESFKVTIVEKPTNVVLNGVKYEIAQKIKVSITGIDYTENKKKRTDTEDYYLVLINNQWKRYYEDTTFNKLMCKAISATGRMYVIGEGKKKDINRGMSLLKKAYTYNDVDYNNLYRLAYAAIDQKDYKEAKTYINKCIANSEGQKNDELSNAYNIKGIVYSRLGDKKNAYKSFLKALNLDPSNEYANQNIESVK